MSCKRHGVIDEVEPFLPEAYEVLRLHGTLEAPLRCLLGEVYAAVLAWLDERAWAIADDVDTVCSVRLG